MLTQEKRGEVVVSQNVSMQDVRQALKETLERLGVKPEEVLEAADLVKLAEGLAPGTNTYCSNGTCCPSQ